MRGMNHDTFFSVVIPTYNRGDLILKTLTTVRSQTYSHYEIIVVDDCSTDNTEEILAPYLRAGSLRYVKHDRNYERASARNTGMEIARGDFLTFLDSDDLMYPTNLEDAAEYVKANPEMKVFHNLYELVAENNKLLCRYDYPALDDPLLAITGGNFLACIGDFIHREIYERYRFDTDPIMVGTEDWDFWLRVLADYNPGRIDKINSGVVQHDGRGIYQLDIRKMRPRYVHLIKKISHDPHLNSIYRDYLSRLEAGSLLYTATHANLTRHHSEALKCLLLAAVKNVRLLSSINFMKALGIAMLRLNKGF
jgi:glycosyltransferase involved in cell wall biosynthesis